MQETLERILKLHYENDGNIISILQGIEDSFGYIPEDAVNWFSERLSIPPANFYGVATFYAQFHLKPRGENIISVCCGTACHVKGSSKIAENIQRELGLNPGEDITEDRKFTFEVVRCVGACSLAPVVIVNSRVYANMTSKSTLKLLKELKKEEKGDRG